MCVEVGLVVGASWGPEDTIVFARDAVSGLDRVSAQGGTPEALTSVDASRRESSHRLPDFLPGGEAVVFTVKTADTASYDDTEIEAVHLRTRQRSVLIKGGSSGRYAGGQLVYARAGSLWAAPLDVARLEVTGPSVAVLPGVWGPGSFGNADFGLSRVGSLVYVPGSLSGPRPADPAGGSRRKGSALDGGSAGIRERSSSHPTGAAWRWRSRERTIRSGSTTWRRAP